MRTAAWIMFAVFLLAHVGLFATNALRSERPWVNHDVAYHGYLGLQVFEGKRLYVDMLEDNPPGNVFLLGAVFRGGQLLRLPFFLAPHVLVLLLGAAGWYVLSDVLRRSGMNGPGSLIVAASYLLVTVRAGFSNNLFAGAEHIPYDFAQREHLFSLLFLPYLLSRVSDRRPRAAFAWWFALGYVSTFKPFWAPMIVVVEALTYAGRKDEPRRDLLGWGALAAGMALPVIVLGIHSPTSLRLFFTQNIPMYLAGSFTHYDTSYAEFARSPLHVQLVAGLLVTLLSLAAAARANLISWRRILMFGTCAAIAYGAVVQQHKFWSYHAVPVFALTVVPAAWLCARLLGAIETPRWRQGACGVAALAVLVAVAASTRDTADMLDNHPPLGDSLVPLVQRYERPLFFSTSVTTTYAPLLLGKPLVGPYTVLVDLPEILALPDAGERARRLDAYAFRILGVIEAERPDLIVYSPETLALAGDVPLHTTLTDIGVVPAALGYRRVPASSLARFDPRLAGWDIYELAAP